MITRTVLMTLVFAVVIGCGAAAYALMNPGVSAKGEQSWYSSNSGYGWNRGDHDDDDDHDDDHDDDDD